MRFNGIDLSMCGGVGTGQDWRVGDADIRSRQRSQEPSVFEPASEYRMANPVATTAAPLAAAALPDRTPANVAGSLQEPLRCKVEVKHCYAGRACAPSSEWGAKWLYSWFTTSLIRC